MRDRVVATYRRWTTLFDEALAEAQARGEIAPSADREQLAFEINAMLAEANGAYLLHDDPRYFDMARRAIADRLEHAAA